MHRFFVPHKLIVGTTVELSNDVLRHLRTVLRLPAGGECELLDGNGTVAKGRIDEDFKISIIGVRQHQEPPCQISLIQGLPKGEKLELVLQKGTELGITRFVPTQMVRSVGRLKPEREQKRLKRWEKIVQEAARQSGQAFLPTLQLERRLEDALATVEADLKLLLWEESDEPLEVVLPEVAPEKISVIVGPEGGITPEEAEKALSAGYKSVSLGARILRTETAGLAIVTILQYLYGDLGKGRCSSNAASQGKDES